MKTRIRGNSIRLRLRQPEVEQIAAGKPVESITDFGTAQLRITLIGKDTTRPSVAFIDNTIMVYASQSALSAWAASNDVVGLYGEQKTSAGEPLTIAIEKDFRCLDRSHADDDQAGTYPHPTAAKIHRS